MTLVYGKSQHSAAQDIYERNISTFANKRDCYKLDGLLYEIWNQRFPLINLLIKLVNTVGWFAAFLNKL